MSARCCVFCTHVFDPVLVASVASGALSVDWLTCRMRVGLQVVIAKLMERIVFVVAGVSVDKDIPMGVMIVTIQAWGPEVPVLGSQS